MLSVKIKNLPSRCLGIGRRRYLSRCLGSITLLILQGQVCLLTLGKRELTRLGKRGRLEVPKQNINLLYYHRFIVYEALNYS